MTEPTSGDGQRRRPGRRRTAALGSDEAGRRLKLLMDERQMTVEALAKALPASQSTILRWRGGERGPDRKMAARVAEVLDEPDFVSWWRWPDHEPDAGLPDTTTSDETGVTHGWRRRPVRLIAGALIVSLLAAVAYGVVRGDGDPRRLPAITGRVNVDLTNGEVGRTVSLWTLPSTDTGCHISRCASGTRRSGVVKRDQEVSVDCVIKGQDIRNGDPSAPDHYNDDRWLRIKAGQDFGQQPDEVVYLSNVFFMRDQLPETLGACPPPS